jgi:hypothetical protein
MRAIFSVKILIFDFGDSEDPLATPGAVAREDGRQGSTKPTGKRAGLRGVLHSMMRTAFRRAAILS